MANPEHLKILKQGVEVWNRWREENPQVTPNFQEADLKRFDARGVDLNYASLQEVHFQQGDLSEANLRNANLQSANLWQVNLEGADLRHAVLEIAYLRSSNMKGCLLDDSYLNNADLEETNVSGGSLRRADLPEANLANSNLEGANLSDSNLQRVSLVDAQLGRADLSRAYLVGADLQGASLAQCDLQGALVGLTKLVAVDLSGADNLAECVHVAPSIIDMRTLDFTARGLAGKYAKIEASKEFLLNAGVAEDVISLFGSWVGRPIGYFSCFISYSHSDKRFAHSLYRRLKAKGIHCWLDDRDLKPGDRILNVVDDAIRLHDKILLCCSEASLESWWVNDEIRKAMERERRDGHDIIIPLMVDHYLLDGWEDGMAADLRSRLAADFTGWEQDNGRFEEQFKRVVRALRTGETAREKLPEPQL